jgi:hypothetical protein
MSNSKEGGRVGVFTLFNQYREVNIPTFELYYLTYINMLCTSKHVRVAYLISD